MNNDTSDKDALGKVKAEQFDLILLDIIMPKVDGFTLLELLKEAGREKGQPIMVLSNLGQKEDIIISH